MISDYRVDFESALGFNAYAEEIGYVADNYVRRTAVTRVSLSERQRGLIEETIEEWLRACQLAADMAWGTCRKKLDVQSLTYGKVRANTDLGSQHAILATHQAAEAISSCLESCEGSDPGSKPTFTSPTLTYDSRSMTLFADDTVSLSTTKDRIRCSLLLPEGKDGYQQQFLESESWSLTESTLSMRDGGFFLHLGFRRTKTDDERNPPENGTVLGVDLGVNNLAVTSTAAFIDGRSLAHEIREFETVRAGLQRKGTRSAFQTMQEASGRQLRHLLDAVHRASKEIVAEAERFDCEIIVFEDLTGIRESRAATWGHRWAFRKLHEYVDYKAEVKGIDVEWVNPASTSTLCSKCGSLVEDNRVSREVFRCEECETELNADYNAAKNIGLRYVRRDQKLSRRTGDSQLALKSGTVTSSGKFKPYSAGPETEFTDNPNFG